MEIKHLPFNDKGEVSNPVYIEDDPNEAPITLLEKWYSKAELKRLVKQKGIQVARKSPTELWIKIGKQLIIIVKEWHFTAQQAQIWWEFHYELMPKVLKWEIVK